MDTVRVQRTWCHRPALTRELIVVRRSLDVLIPAPHIAAVQTSLNNVARDLAKSFPAADAELSLVVARHNHLVALPSLNRQVPWQRFH